MKKIVLNGRQRQTFANLFCNIAVAFVAAGILTPIFQNKQFLLKDAIMTLISVIIAFICIFSSYHILKSENE